MDSNLYGADGNPLGHPDGGITSQGDGSYPDFSKSQKEESIIWNDERVADPGLVQAAAPIESIEVLVLESFPPHYNVVVYSGLPDGCTVFGGYRKARQGKDFQIELLNVKPADPQTICAQVYETVETNISLGSDFEPGETYTVTVNGVTESFVAQ